MSVKALDDPRRPVASWLRHSHAIAAASAPSATPTRGGRMRARSQRLASRAGSAGKDKYSTGARRTVAQHKPSLGATPKGGCNQTPPREAGDSVAKPVSSVGAGTRATRMGRARGPGRPRAEKPCSD